MILSLSPKHVAIGASWLFFGAKAYAAWRQHQRLGSAALPAGLAARVSETEFARARRFGRDKLRVDVAQALCVQLATSAVLALDALPQVWDHAGTALRCVGLGGSHETLQTMLLASAWGVGWSLFNAPWHYVYNSLERKHNLSKTTTWGVFSQKLKEFLIGYPVIIAFTPVAVKVLKFGRNRPILSTILVLTSMTLGALMAPQMTSMTFSNYKRVEDQEIATGVALVAEKSGFTVVETVSVDASRVAIQEHQRTSHSGVYVHGLLQHKRVHVSETLFEEMDKLEILALSAREFGHWNIMTASHKLALALMGSASNIMNFSMFATNSACLDDFGFFSENPLLISSILSHYANLPLSSTLVYAYLYFARAHEFQADQAAKKLGLGQELKTALIKLNIKHIKQDVRSLSVVDPDPLYSFLTWDCPTLGERLRAL
ncbi:hypothetical protein BDR26DRAFT_919248 [Obelidium mucronatum]|nr:hypothetical protein BDR26DRAFT_919248 [Obelidium mucronatum]